MPELENVIENIMSTPESLGRIMDIVKMFGGEGQEEKKEEELPSLSGIFSEGNNLDPALLSKVMSLLGEYNADDRRIQLLGAIRPYLKSEDGYHIDRAIQIVKLSHVARGLLGNFLK